MPRSMEQIRGGADFSFKTGPIEEWKVLRV